MKNYDQISQRYSFNSYDTVAQPNRNSIIYHLFGLYEGYIVTITFYYYYYYYYH